MPTLGVLGTPPQQAYDGPLPGGPKGIDNHRILHGTNDNHRILHGTIDNHRILHGTIDNHRILTPLLLVLLLALREAVVLVGIAVVIVFSWLDWTGLDWTGLDWTGWTGLDWTGLDWEKADGKRTEEINRV